MPETEKMPPLTYLFARPESRLTLAKKDDLVKGLVSTFGVEDRRTGAPPARSGKEKD